MEIWDLYHRDGTLAGGEVRRGDPLPDGLYHLACEVLLRHADGDFLLMRRDLKKRSFPGLYEASAGGAAQKGEGPMDCIRRELKEETGLTARDFREVNVQADGDCLFHSFVATTDCPKDSVALQPGETIGYKWVGPEAFLVFIASKEAIPGQARNYAAYLKSEFNVDVLK